ncbi:hypothetical protein TNCV_639851 [Trichonephila clavipes]|nr:hypothetical protein TNCV_639851 [Trichonephila clavipes]
MHLPLIRTGISVKADTSFVPPTVASANATCRFFSSSYRLRKKIAAFFFSLRFGVPGTRFGAVKPSLPLLFPSGPPDVTLVSFSFVCFLPAAYPLRGE